MQGLIYHIPSPLFTPYFLLTCSLPLVLQMSQSPFPYSSPPPALFQGQTPLHHYTEMDNSDGGVCVCLCVCMVVGVG